MTIEHRIALVSMPTLAARFPSFQLALLKPTLEKAGFRVDPFSLFLNFGQRVGWNLNDTVSNLYPSMIGEWLWGKAAFGDFASEPDYLEQFDYNLGNICRKARCTTGDLLKIRHTTTFEFLDWCVESIDWSQYAFVGFTVVFQQMVASMALAKRLKAKYPKLPIVFGGATFEDELAEQVLTHCPYVDVVNCGDGDLTLPELATRLANRLPLTGMPGAMHRKGGQLAYAGRAPNLEELDLTPIPDFDEYFATRRSTRYEESEDRFEVLLPIETARGCWYGMKNHCTFCGLNRSGMEFRQKSAENVLEMLKALSRRYGIVHFSAIDNILAPEYAQKLFGRLAEEKSDFRLHYEVRPNLSRSQLKLLRLGGLDSVQPGVESLSTHVLTLMKKFTTGMKNLELLKWTTYYGIDNQYNLLYGFSGETAEDYASQALLIPKLAHLQPPYCMAPARADRGSPMYERPTEHGLEKLRPDAVYRFIYPPQFDLQKISYFFEDDRPSLPPPAAYADCIGQVDAWKARWETGPRPSLTYVKGWGTITIHDRRDNAVDTTRLDDRGARLYELCGDARRHEELVNAFDGDSVWVDGMLGELCELELIVHLDDKYLALALPANPNH